MAALSEIFVVKFTANVTVVGVTETVIATLAGVSTKTPTSSFTLLGWAQLTPGTDATSIKLAIRRTSVSGTLVGEANGETFGAAASQVRGQTIVSDDAPGDVASMAYVLTALQAGGTADGTALQGYLMALSG
jgi:hypothetical protein